MPTPLENNFTLVGETSVASLGGLFNGDPLVGFKRVLAPTSKNASQEYKSFSSFPLGRMIVNCLGEFFPLSSWTLIGTLVSGGSW